jgi:hypothetical protein
MQRFARKTTSRLFGGFCYRSWDEAVLTIVRKRSNKLSIGPAIPLSMCYSRCISSVQVTFLLYRSHRTSYHSQIYT